MDIELENIVSGLSKQEKQALRELLDRELKPNDSNSERQPRNFGWAGGKIRISSDFDEPLEDFREYME